MKQPASIFNDVLGPIMTGPSSSHTAGPCRIGLIGYQLCADFPEDIEIRFDKRGSFAASYDLQGTDRGLVGGLMGLSPDEERLHTALQEAKARGIQVQFLIDEFEADHPNTAKITVRTRDGEVLRYTGQSLGGGMFRVAEVNGFPVEITGDTYELLVVTTPERAGKILAHLQKSGMQTPESVERDRRLLIHGKYLEAVSTALLERLRAEEGVAWVGYVEPVLPILTGEGCRVPFSTNRELMEWIEETGLAYWEAGAYYEVQRGHTSKEAVWKKMEHIADVMRASVMEGLEHRIPGQILSAKAADYAELDRGNRLLPLGVMNTAIAWCMAVVEVNSRYGRLVAAPTAGACGVIPGAILGTAEGLGLSRDDVVKALFAAGIVGVFIAEHATFAAEVAGCQAECGAGSAMAAAGVVQLYGGTPAQCAAAASMALQNVLGMICDSVADLVEVPCLGRNVIGAVNAIACANMVLAGVREVIPLDETITSMLEVGNMMPSELCCTGKGGLAITETSKCIKHRLGYC